MSKRTKIAIRDGAALRKRVKQLASPVNQCAAPTIEDIEAMIRREVSKQLAGAFRAFTRPTQGRGGCG